MLYYNLKPRLKVSKRTSCASSTRAKDRETNESVQRCKREGEKGETFDQRNEERAESLKNIGLTHSNELASTLSSIRYFHAQGAACAHSGDHKYTGTPPWCRLRDTTVRWRHRATNYSTHGSSTRVWNVIRGYVLLFSFRTRKTRFRVKEKVKTWREKFL